MGDGVVVKDVGVDVKKFYGMYFVLGEVVDVVDGEYDRLLLVWDKGG